jgi:hypothetical protein
VLSKPFLQRLQPPAGAADPVGKGRAVDLDALPGKDLALPVEGQMIAVFGDQDMSEQGGVARPLAIGRSGAGAWWMVPQARQP